MKKILAVGSLAFDSLKTPSGEAERVLGGSCNYFSLSASFFTGLKIVAVVGDDFPETHLQELNRRGVDTKGVQHAKGKTFHWVGEYGKDLNEAITKATHLNVFEHFNPEIPQDYCNSEYVFLGNIAPALQLRVLDQVKNPRLIALDSMNFWINGARNDLLKVLERIDLITINEGEAKLLANESNVVLAAEKILSMGPKCVVVKRGEYGSFLFFENDIFSAPAVPIRRVVDPTGAGDTFAGGLMGWIAKNGAGLDWKTLKQAVLHGSVMASFTVEDFGFQRLLRLEKSEIERRYDTLLKVMAP